MLDDYLRARVSSALPQLLAVASLTLTAALSPMASAQDLAPELASQGLTTDSGSTNNQPPAAAAEAAAEQGALLPNQRLVESPAGQANGDSVAVLTAEATFELYEVQLDDVGRQALKAMTNQLLAFDHIASIRVIGHADSRGDSARNQVLSEQRAASVVTLLRPDFPDTHVIALGKGDSEPIANNDTVAGRARNRRAEIQVIAVRHPAPLGSLEADEEPGCSLDSPTIPGLQNGVTPGFAEQTHERIWQLAATRIAREAEESPLINGVSRSWSRVWLDCAQINAIGISARPAASVEPEIQQSNDSNSGAFIVSEEAPPGFEGLLGPVTHFVDLRFNETIVGTALITVTAETFFFDEPGSIPPLLNGVLDPENLLPILAGEFDTNAHLLCFAPEDPSGCGVVDADPIAALFDENALILDLFVAPALQTPQLLSAARYLASPAKQPTSLLSINAIATDLQDNNTALDVYLRALGGYGRGNVSTELEHNTRSDESRLRELRLTHYFNDQELSLGSFNYSPGAGLGNANLVGVQFQTSYNSRVDLEQAFSSELVIYLPRRSVVQLAIDDRVYSGDSYPAGNQTLDTRSLPDGTYQLEIRVLDAIGNVRSEFRTFTKSTDLPPTGEWVFSLTAGLPLFFAGQDTNDLGLDSDDGRVSTGIVPRTGAASVLAASISRRLTNQSAWRLGLLGLGHEAAVQGSLIYLGQRLSAQFSGSFGRSDLLSTESRVSLTVGNTSATASLLTSRHNASSDAADTGIPLDDFDQASLSMSRNFQHTQLTLRTTRRRGVNQGSRADIAQSTLSARRTLFRRNSLRGYLTAEIQRDEDTTRVGLSINVNLDRRSLSTTLLGGAEQIDNDISGFAGIATRYGYTGPSSSDWELGAYATTRDTSEDTGVSLGVQYPRFSISGSTDWTRDGGEVSQNSIASFSAHAGIDASGVALGGNDFAEAGLIVDVDGEPAGAVFDIIVNNRKLAESAIGTAQFVSLRPFEAYRVKLLPRSLLSNGIDEEIYEFTLYPGSIERISIEARREFLLVASLVNERDELIVDALVQTEDNPALIDSSGVFQAEVAPGERLVVMLADGSDCVFNTPEATTDDDILIPDEPLPCLAQDETTTGTTQ